MRHRPSGQPRLTARGAGDATSATMRSAPTASGAAGAPERYAPDELAESAIL